MANQGNSRNKNRGGYNQDWNMDENRTQRNANQDQDRSRYGSNENQGRSDYGGSYDQDRGNDWRSRNSMYGSSTGMMPGGSYGGNSSDRDDDWNEGRSSQQAYGRSHQPEWGMSSDRAGYGNQDRNSYANQGRGMYGGEGRGYGDTGRSRFGNDQNRGQDRDWWDKTKDEVSSWFGDDDADRRRRQDEGRGEHRGKGPKGYTRSDERIKEDVNDRLSDDPHVDASEIDVAVQGCEVTLTGTVNSRQEKRHAEDLAERISGVKNVENRLRVSNAQANAGTQGSQGNNSLGQPYRTSSNAGAYDSSKS